MHSKRFTVQAAIAALLIAVVILSACAPQTPAPVEPTKPAEQQAPAASATKKIGFSVYDMQYGFFQDMERGTREAAEAAGYEYVLVDQKSSESTMVSATQDLLNQGISALIISPFKPDALGPIVDAAKAKGIPVVVNDIGGGGTDYDVIVISDNEKGGVIAAEEMDKLISAKGAAKKVASITCEPSAVYAARRNVGFEAKIKELGYEVVATLSGNSRQEEGYKVMKDILSAHPDVAGVFSCNDPMGVGAAQAIADSGKSGATDIFVIGFNADEIALKAIQAGQMAATVQQVPYEMGKMTVDLATKLLAGEKLTFGNDAEREIYVPVNLITPANVGTLLAPAPAAELPGKGKKIGFSVYDMQYGFFQDMERGTREAAEAAGYEYVLVDQKSSESTMVSATQDLLNQGISALIISPFKPDALGPIVDAAKAKGIPVVVNDIGGGGTDYDVIVISDNEKGGVIAAEEMDKLISAKGAAKKVASITCEPSAVYAARRNVGFEAKIKELGYEVVATLSGNSRQEEGYKVMKDILSAHPDVAGVFSCNDPMGVGAAQAIADSGKSGATDIFVIGFNADEIALKAIQAGQMAATVQQVPYEMGKMTVDLATKLLAGEKLTFGNDAEREIYVPVNLITPANVDTLLK